MATAGFLVVVPELLYGDYFDLDNPQFDRAAWLQAHGAVSFLLTCAILFFFSVHLIL